MPHRKPAGATDFCIEYLLVQWPRGITPRRRVELQPDVYPASPNPIYELPDARKILLEEGLAPHATNGVAFL